MAQRLGRHTFSDAVADLYSKAGSPGELAELLMQKFQGRIIPRPTPADMAERNARIRAAVSADEPYREIARREGLSVSTVFEIAQKPA